MLWRPFLVRDLRVIISWVKGNIFCELLPLQINIKSCFKEEWIIFLFSIKREIIRVKWVNVSSSHVIEVIYYQFSNSF